MSARYTPEERQVLYRLSKSSAIKDFKARVEAELRRGLSLFVGAHSTPQVQKQIEYFTRSVMQKYEKEWNETFPHEPFPFKTEYKLNGVEFNTTLGHPNEY